MIARAIVVDIDDKQNKLQLNIPIINDPKIDINNGEKEDLSWATILYIPGIEVDYKVGDIVIVGFEGNNLSLPIVLGHLKTSNGKNESRVNGTFKELIVSDYLSTPINTQIGGTNYGRVFEAMNSLGMTTANDTNNAATKNDNTGDNNNDNQNNDNKVNKPQESIWISALDVNGKLNVITAKQVPDDIFVDIDAATLQRASDCLQMLKSGKDCFNCYAYAINTYDDSYTGSAQDQFRIGEFSKSKIATTSTRGCVQAILSDLSSVDPITDNLHPLLNKKNIKWTLKVPDLEEFNDGKSHLIAFRGCVNSANNVSDYHFMRYDPTTKSWLHKNGGDSAILKLKTNPWEVKSTTGISMWPSEHCFKQIDDGTDFAIIGNGILNTSKMLIAKSGSYTGNIVYIRYDD